jgi:hypothetical protein
MLRILVYTNAAAKIKNTYKGLGSEARLGYGQKQTYI